MPRFFRRFSSRKRHLTEAAADLEETKQLKKSAKERRLAARAKAGLQADAQTGGSAEFYNILNILS